jgi:hypothetical protein
MVARGRYPSCRGINYQHTNTAFSARHFFTFARRGANSVIAAVVTTN